MTHRSNVAKDDIKSMEGTAPYGWVRWTGYAMCVWSLLFAALHFYKAVDGTFLSSPIARNPTSTEVNIFPWLFCAGILCVIAIVIILALIQARSQSLPHWLMQISSFSGGGMLLLYLVYSFFEQGNHWMLACAILCTVGAILALALTQSWGQNISRWLMLLFVWLGGIILTLHSLYGYVVHGLVMEGVITWEQSLRWAGAPATSMSTEAIQTMITQNLLIWNPWFLIGGILFLTVAWQAHGTKSNIERNVRTIGD